MKRIIFTRHVLPHLGAVFVFLAVTVIFFSPIIFENKSLKQHDISQWFATAKSLIDYRLQTGEEGLWSPSIFSGMPAYLVNIGWGDEVLRYVKKIFSFALPHPIQNLYWAFLNYYILLLAFRIRPLFAMVGALAFGLSSYMIIGLANGHNLRIGAIAFIPLVMAGIHLVFSDKKWLGFATTGMGMGLQLLENHLQMTYYLLIIVVVYGLVQLVMAVYNKQIIPFFTRIGTLVFAVIIAVGTCIGPLWGVAEYSRYSIRGPSELTGTDNESAATGLTKDYAFAYSNGIAEPMTLLIPNFYGGSSANYLVQNPQSTVYKALMTNAQNPNLSQQLMRYTSAYWGPQSYTSPYYAGAIVLFLFVLGMTSAEKKYIWWLTSISILGIILSWGSSFSAFNYFVFDYLPGYNKFRSMTFALIIPIFAMPLLGMLGLEKVWSLNTDKAKKKILFAFVSTGGLCALLWLIAGMISFLRPEESSLPAWFTNALASDRRALFRQDALRSLIFILLFSVSLILVMKNIISQLVFSIIFALLMLLDLTMIDRRYLNANNYKSSYTMDFPTLDVDKEIAKDTSYYRVYNIQENWSQEARTAYFHNSIGGYNAAKLRRYQELYDSCLNTETKRFINEARSAKLDFSHYGVANMLNVKYFIFGAEKNHFIQNPNANGNAWFVKHVKKAHSPKEELQTTCFINTRSDAVINGSKFKVPNVEYDSLASISLTRHSPAYLSYDANSSKNGLVVFSEIFYPLGWYAFIDGKETPILQVNYVLRALEVPAGRHRIEFKFEPKPYIIGNKIMIIASWILALSTLGSIFWSIKSYVYTPEQSEG